MGSPKVFSLKPPVEATEIPKKRESTRGSDHGPNLFLQADPPQYPYGWFMKSYETGKWMDVNDVAGEFVEDTVKYGATKGQVVERMTGDLAEVTRQLREAAKLLDKGVTIKYFPMVYKSGPKKDQEIPGKWQVKYLAQNRKQTRKPKVTGNVPASE